jgi:hypothetical protein
MDISHPDPLSMNSNEVLKELEAGEAVKDLWMIRVELPFQTWTKLSWHVET